MSHLETEYTTHDGIKLFLQAWMPEKAVASILIVHGLGEHSSRYAHLADALVKKNVAVFTFDGRGHGKSSLPKPTAYFSDYKDYLQDIDALFEKVKNYFPSVPAFIFGHSMGGGLVASYMLEYQSEAAGVILSAPAMKPDDKVSPILLRLSGLISAIFPKLKVLQLDSSKISRDPLEVDKYNRDPLVYTQSIPSRTAYQLLRIIKYIESNSNKFHWPVLMLHGTGDELTNPKGTEQFFRTAISEDKTFHRYPDLYHELINELEKESIISDILDWIEERVNLSVKG
ncbi:alpha/beta hydrolase [Mongoliibacter ruber]|uniref:Monoacylglycerol lipase n=1 Tax=Mongoliibacter ruber TaxID=1750599 RepID=A0A2T0WJS6_9BACT|nr:alpha/beta hydrolase [Mongoliibacter ruber]PRY86947.1 alpha-beta hydrolase superfamily lysophospholipase [Mongoliibacter ruber]